jgi:S1-C subfamily serine protease
MQFITDLVVAALMAYLAFTNYLAVQVSTLLGEETYEAGEVITDEDSETGDTNEAETEETSALTPLTSIFAKIPDILLRSAEYQRATIVESIAPTATTSDPLLALVNIYCTFTNDRTIRTTTGTGFIVSDRGVILTNAHVAQFLLLETTDALGESTCTVRNGSPAAARYEAELLYIPPAWVEEHAALIDADSPSGTGERDYALLHITKSIDSAPLPARFPALALRTEPLTARAIRGTVTALGYPALYAEGDTATNLRSRTATTSISELFTFGSTEVDVLALRGSSMGQQGASGGPVINEDGYVIGMIATRGNDAKDGEGSLRAISIDHINRTITEETNNSIEKHLAGDIESRASVFTRTMTPFLAGLLAQEVSE